MKYGHLRRGNPGHEAPRLKGGWVFQLFTMFLMQFLLAAAAVALYEDEIFASGGSDTYRKSSGRWTVSGRFLDGFRTVSGH